MTWYAAHLVMVVEYKHGRQTRFPVWENIVLVRAASVDEAFAKAEKRGQEDAGDDDDSFHWEGRPARWVFAGVRKLTTCEDPGQRPGDGTEVTYLEMELPSREMLEKYIAGEPVSVKLMDGFPDEENDPPADRKLKVLSQEHK
jgi:hypothetical protein